VNKKSQRYSIGFFITRFLNLSVYPLNGVYHEVASTFDLHIAQVLGAPDYVQHHQNCLLRSALEKGDSPKVFLK
jgi:hypothetical protein